MIKEDLKAGKIKQIYSFKSRVNGKGELEVFVPVEEDDSPSLLDLFERNLSAIGWEKEVFIKKDGAFDRMVTSKNIEKTETGFVIYHRNYIYI